MLAAQELRKIINSFLPQLQINPDKLAMFITNGSIECHYGDYSFRQNYNLEIHFTEVKQEKYLNIFLPILIFLQKYFPEKAQNPETAKKLINYDIELIDDTACNIIITLQLNEIVEITPVNAGYSIAPQMLYSGINPYSETLEQGAWGWPFKTIEGV